MSSVMRLRATSVPLASTKATSWCFSLQSIPHVTFNACSFEGRFVQFRAVQGHAAP